MRRYFLDTNILVGSLAASRRLDSATRALLEDRNNELLSSAVCIWEVAIKNHKYPDITPSPVDVLAGVASFGVTLVDISAVDCLEIVKLPRLHADPYDHLILAQARKENAQLLTSDKTLGQYGGDVTVVKLKP